MKRCFTGSEAIDWLTKMALVHGRFHAISMLQPLLEGGVITSGKDWGQIDAQPLSYFKAKARGGRALPMMDYTGRLCSKRVPFSGWRYMKG